MSVIPKRFHQKDLREAPVVKDTDLCSAIAIHVHDIPFVPINIKSSSCFKMFFTVHPPVMWLLLLKAFVFFSFFVFIVKYLAH